MPFEAKRDLNTILGVSIQLSLFDDMIGPDECHLRNSLADFGVHNMRSDRIRLLVNNRCKNSVVTKGGENGGVHCPSTHERVPSSP
ncbi:hypothetical protein KEM54_001656 [Ascosphaera aggregata]|nr:hypothetical protein KEM54_001656 [Ascosphaera aggregata]